MLSKIIFLSFVSAVAFGVTFDDCPAGLKHDMNLKVFEESCYRFEVDEKMEFQKAQDQCQKDGGNLALVQTADINSFISNELTTIYKVYSEPVWIGLRYDSLTLGLRWVDGSNVTYKRFFGADSYIRHECIGILPTTGYWHGYRCRSSSQYEEKKNYFVCQYPASQNNSSSSTTTSPTGPAVTLDDCPFALARDNYLDVFGDNCYRFNFYSSYSFDQAQQYCRRHGGNLALIKTKEMNNFIHDHIKYTYKRGFKPVWIGIRNDNKDNAFKWIDGSKVNYSNFRRGEQTDGGKCGVLMPYDGTWKTLACDDSKGNVNRPFVCEYQVHPKPATSLPPTKHSTCPVIDSNLHNYKVFRNKCYYFNLKEELTFDKAEKFCENFGGMLVLVKTKVIENFLQQELHSTHHLGFYSPSLWIGLRYDITRRGFYWVDGTLVDYSNFEYEDSTGECIALLPWSGRWEDIHCHNKAPYVIPKRFFICEFEERFTTTTNSVTTASVFGGTSTIEVTSHTNGDIETPPVTPDEAATTKTTTLAPKTTANPTTTTTTTSSESARPLTADTTTKITPPETTTTAVTLENSSTCGPFNCNIDCQMDGYIIDLATGCTLCQCA